MNRTTAIYDFDGTIYERDASIDFIKFCMKRDIRLWRFIPMAAVELFLFLLGIGSKERVKTASFRFLVAIDNRQDVITAFWLHHEQYIARWYLEKKQPSDIIISASPEFLLEPMTQKLEVRKLLATKIDDKSGKVIGKNCHGEEKVKRLHRYDNALSIGDVYSDSLSDAPLFDLSQRVFIVKKGVVMRREAYKPSRMSLWLTLTFLRFLIVGGINAWLGILLSYAWVFVVGDALLAFFIGYSISLVLSYFLNAIITFHELHFSLRQFGRFIVSYIPNFCVLVIGVYVFANILHLYSLVSYILAAIIAAPVTFLLLSKFTFVKRAHE